MRRITHVLDSKIKLEFTTVKAEYLLSMQAQWLSLPANALYPVLPGDVQPAASLSLQL